MKATEIQKGDEFWTTDGKRVYRVVEVSREADVVKALVLYDMDGGSDWRYWHADTEVNLIPGMRHE